jgi:hypothetical protein
MGLAEILASIDSEISTLQRARALLAAGAHVGRKRGRPSKTAAVVNALISTPAKKRKKRNLTPEGRKRIADAQKRRWAAMRKSAAGAK